MSTEHGSADPLEFMRKLWGQMGFALPGMVTPTLDVDELERRIADLKAVEGWLRMNHNMLQMTIQGLEIQRATLAAVKAMSERSLHPAAEAGAAQTPSGDAAETPNNPFNPAVLWPWLAQSMSPRAAPAAEPEAAAPADEAAKPSRSRRTARKPGAAS